MWGKGGFKCSGVASRVQSWCHCQTAWCCVTCPAAVLQQRLHSLSYNRIRGSVCGIVFAPGCMYVPRPLPVTPILAAVAITTIAGPLPCPADSFFIFCVVVAEMSRSLPRTRLCGGGTYHTPSPLGTASSSLRPLLQAATPTTQSSETMGRECEAARFPSEIVERFLFVYNGECILRASTVTMLVQPGNNPYSAFQIQCRSHTCGRKHTSHTQ